MPQYQAPNPYPDFAESSDALVSQPTPSLQASGFTLNQRPSAGNVNWLFRQLGRAVRYLSQGVNAVLVGAAQETDYRLIGGGSWGWNATTGVLAWSDAAYLACPGLLDAANTIAAGSVTLAAGQVAYIAANVPFSTTGDTTSGSATVANLAYESGIVVGATCTGPGIPAGATVTAVSQSDSTITLSAPATASAAGVQLVFATSNALTVQSVASSSFSPSSNTVVLARCVAGSGMPNHVFVGVNSGQMVLRDGEAKRLLAGGYATTVALPAGQDMPAQTVVYLSPGGFSDANRSKAVYPADASNTLAVRANVIGITASAVSAGSTVEVVVSGRLPFTAGGLTAGATHYLSATSPGSLSASAPTGAGQTVVALGIASTASTLLLGGNAVPAPVAAYKSRVEMGRYFSRAAGGSAWAPLYELYYDTSNNASSPQIIQLVALKPMTHSGSIVALSVRAFAGFNVVTSVYLYKNGNPLILIGNGLPANQTSLITPFNKGTYAFAAGDILSANVLFGGGNANAVNAALDIAITVEMAP